MKSNKSLKFTIWIYLSVFSVLILSFLWLFQTTSLDNYYKWSKTKELKKVALSIKKEYTNDESVFNDILYKKGICIDIYKDNYLITYNNNFNKSCSPTTDIKIYQEILKNNNNEDTVFTNDKNNISNIKMLVYGFVLEDDTYIFLTTSIVPVDSTVTILKSQLIIITFVILVLSFLVSWFISKKLSKPIIELNNSAKKVAKGDYTSNFTSNTNITELKELSTTLNYAKDELSKTDNLRKDLLANISHDLKTPLTMIKAYTEMVKDFSYKDKKKRDENLNIILEEVDRLNLLVSDILDLSVIQSNIYELKKEEFDLINMIKTIINRFKIFTTTGDYNFVLNTKLNKMIVNADKHKLEQVIYNLIGNAINYTGEDKKITIKITDNKDSYKIEITDTGKGIDKDEIDLVWDKYYKSDKKYQRNKIGTGLGLSIVKNILELHCYNYGINSKKNKGTTFYFEIKKD